MCKKTWTEPTVEELAIIETLNGPAPDATESLSRTTGLPNGLGGSY